MQASDHHPYSGQTVGNSNFRGHISGYSESPGFPSFRHKNFSACTATGIRQADVGFVGSVVHWDNDCAL